MERSVESALAPSRLQSSTEAIIEPQRRCKARDKAQAYLKEPDRSTWWARPVAYTRQPLVCPHCGAATIDPACQCTSNPDANPGQRPRLCEAHHRSLRSSNFTSSCRLHMIGSQLGHLSRAGCLIDGSELLRCDGFVKRRSVPSAIVRLRRSSERQ